MYSINVIAILINVIKCTITKLMMNIKGNTAVSYRMLPSIVCFFSYKKFETCIKSGLKQKGEKN